MESTAGLIKLKKGYKDDLQEWKTTLEVRQDEVIETLRREGVELECWFYIEVKGDPYLLWFIRVESMKKAQEIFADSELEIDIFHKDKMSKIRDSGIEADLVLSLSAVLGTYGINLIAILRRRSQNHDCCPLWNLDIPTIGK